MARQRAIAKISAPRLFGVVARQRLFAQLDENRGRPLIWIDGPPGAGKTTLIVSYLHARAIPAVWYQVDRSDSDPANLFHYLGLAATRFPETDRSTLPAILPEHWHDLHAFARTFFGQLFAQLPSGAVVVLDNYQEAPIDGLLHEAIRGAVAEVPPGGSIVCISRSMAPEPFAQFVADGAFFALHWELLQLTLDETREMCARRSVRADGLVRGLHQQSGGWAAGVTLMLERLSQGSAAPELLHGDTRDAVFHYFANLLFGQSPESTRHTLECVAFLPYVTVAIAVELSGRNDAGQVLEQLCRKHLFVDRRPGAEPVYQFHALFREFLQTRVVQASTAETLHDLKLRSARALNERGDINAAMDLWVSTKSWPEAVRAILEVAGGLLNSGRRQTLEHWILGLPAPIRTEAPWLGYWLGMARLQIAPESGIEVLRATLQAMKRADEAQGAVMCITALLNTAFLGYFAVEAVDAWLDGLLDEVKNLPASTDVDAELRLWGALCSALFWTRPAHPWTMHSVRRVEDLLREAKDPNAALGAAASALATAALSGDFERGDRVALATEHLVNEAGASPAEAAWWLNRAGYLRFIEARYEESLDLLARAERLADANNMRTMLMTTIHHRFMVEFRVSGWSRANLTLSRMEAMPPPTYPVVEAMLDVYRARHAQFHGRQEEAADLAERTHAAILRTGSSYQEMLFGMVDAELLLDAGRTEKARPLIVRSRALIESATVFDNFQATLAFIEARLAQVEGDRALALERLKEALVLAKPGNRRYFLRYLECAMPHLFTLALQEGIEMEFVQRLIRTFRLRPPANAPDSWPWPVRIRTLGRFEVLIDDRPLEFARKVPKKTLALLKALVAHGGQDVSEQTLCDALWGDEEADAARQALSITVVRLRKLLGVDDVLSQQGGKLSLDPSLCWVDAWRFEQHAVKPQTAREAVLALKFYYGSFLPEDETEAWSVPARERLRGRFIHLLATYGEALETQDDWTGAADLYLRGIDADAIVEAFYQGLMRCYAGMGRHTEAVAAYRRLRQTLSVVLGVVPSPRSRELFEEVRRRCAAGAEIPCSAFDLTGTVRRSDD